MSNEVEESVTRAQRQSFGHDWYDSGCQTYEDGSSPKEKVSLEGEEPSTEPRDHGYSCNGPPAATTLKLSLRPHIAPYFLHKGAPSFLTSPFLPWVLSFFTALSYFILCIALKCTTYRIRLHGAYVPFKTRIGPTHCNQCIDCSRLYA